MRQLADLIDNIEENIITIILPVMCLIVFMGTFFRFTKLLILPWTEEAARYLLVWLVFLGLGTGAKNNKHFGVSEFIKMMPKWSHKYFEALRTTIIVLFCTYVIYLSLILMRAQVRMQQTSAALHIPIWLAYLAVPVGMGLLGIRTTQYYLKALKHLGEE